MSAFKLENMTWKEMKNMNTNNVYVAYICVKYKSIYDSVVQNYSHKVALVYEKETRNGPIYIDISTKEQYSIFRVEDAPTRTYYIRDNPGLIPYRQIVKDCPKVHMSKRKILKKYRENNKY